MNLKLVKVSIPVLMLMMFQSGNCFGPEMERKMMEALGLTSRPTMRPVNEGTQAPNSRGASAGARMNSENTAGSRGVPNSADASADMNSGNTSNGREGDSNSRGASADARMNSENASGSRGVPNSAADASADMNSGNTSNGREGDSNSRGASADARMNSENASGSRGVPGSEESSGYRDDIRSEEERERQKADEQFAEWHRESWKHYGYGDPHRYRNENLGADGRSRSSSEGSIWDDIKDGKFEQFPDINNYERRASGNSSDASFDNKNGVSVDSLTKEELEKLQSVQVTVDGKKMPFFIDNNMVFIQKNHIDTFFEDAKNSFVLKDVATEYRNNDSSPYRNQGSVNALDLTLDQQNELTDKFDAIDLHGRNESIREYLNQEDKEILPDNEPVWTAISKTIGQRIFVYDCDENGSHVKKFFVYGQEFEENGTQRVYVSNSHYQRLVSDKQ